MKRIFFILLLLFGYAQAQNLPPYKPMFAGTVNEWWITICGQFGGHRNYHYFTNAKQDTVIDGKVYLKFYFAFQEPNPIDTVIGGFVREDTTERKVYLRSTNSGTGEGVLWDFSLSVNDSVKLLWPTCETIPFIESGLGFVSQGVITFIDTISFEDISYRNFFCSSGSSMCEVIGNESTGPFPTQDLCGSVEELPLLLFRKRDAVYLYKNPSFDDLMHSPCVGPLNIEKKQEFLKSKVNYNNKTDKIEFLADRIKQISIYDLNGSLLFSQKIESSQQSLSLSDLSKNGILIAICLTDEGHIYNFRFIK